MKNKIIQYILFRTLFFAIPIITFYFGAFYTLPKYIQEDGFCFMSEIDRFFELSLIFSIIFLAFLYWEIHKFNTRKQINLRNTALIFAVFMTIIVFLLVYLNSFF